MDTFRRRTSYISYTRADLQDVLPVIEIGGHGVLIPAALGWAHEDAADPDDVAVVREAARGLRESEGRGETGVVAERRVGIEGQVGGVEGHAVLDEERDDPVVETGDADEGIAPADAVVDEADVGAFRGRRLEELQGRIDAAADSRHSPAVGDLQAVVRDIREGVEPEFGVEGLREGVEGDRHG